MITRVKGAKWGGAANGATVPQQRLCQTQQRRREAGVSLLSGLWSGGTLTPLNTFRSGGGIPRNLINGDLCLAGASRRLFPRNVKSRRRYTPMDLQAIYTYWAIQRSWFARVNALCNLSRKTSREVAAHFRADF